jgi:cleavage and polyadenylation specificity factor subunit 3
MCSHAHLHADSRAELPSTRLEHIAWFLEAHFGKVELHMSKSVETLGGYEEGGSSSEPPVLVVRVHEAEVHVNPVSLVGCCCFDEAPGLY